MVTFWTHADKCPIYLNTFSNTDMDWNTLRVTFRNFQIMVTDERHCQNANYRYIFQKDDTVCIKDDPGVLYR